MRDRSLMTPEDFAEEERWFADQAVAHSRMEEENERRRRAAGPVFVDDDLPVDIRWDREREDREMR